LIYVGVAMRAVLRAPDAATREICYQMFRDLLNVVRPPKSP
jgi:hypothetical protein